MVMDLDAIAAAFGVRLSERMVREFGHGDDAVALKRKMYEALRINDAATRRAALAGFTEFGMGEGDAIGVLFCFAHAMGDGAALRRARLALTDPRAKGREVEVIDALIAGADIEGALRQAATPEGASSDAAVVPFRRP